MYGVVAATASPTVQPWTLKHTDRCFSISIHITKWHARCCCLCIASRTCRTWQVLEHSVISFPTSISITRVHREFLHRIHTTMHWFDREFAIRLAGQTKCLEVRWRHLASSRRWWFWSRILWTFSDSWPSITAGSTSWLCRPMSFHWASVVEIFLRGLF